MIRRWELRFIWDTYWDYRTPTPEGTYFSRYVALKLAILWVLYGREESRRARHYERTGEIR